MSKIIYLLSICSLLTFSPGSTKAADVIGIYASANSGTGFSAVGAPVLSTPDGAIFVASMDAKGGLLRGSGRITTNCIFTTDGNNIDIGNNFVLSMGCAQIMTGPPLADPLAGLTPPLLSSCDFSDVVIVNDTQTLSPGTYCKGLTIVASSVTLTSGIYNFREGDVVITGSSNVNGDGVLLHLSDQGILQIDATSTVTLSSSMSGDYEDIAIFHSTSNLRKSDKIYGSVDINGSIYVPGGELELGSNNNLNFAASEAAIDVRNLKISGTPNIVVKSGE